MFTSFLQGILGKIVPVLSIVLGLFMIVQNAIGAGVTVMALGIFFGAFLSYLSGHTVRVRK